MARLLRPPLRHEVDAETTAHTFRAHASFHCMGLALVVFAVSCGVAFVASLGDSSLGEEAGFFALALALGWLARRALTLKAVVTPYDVVAVNWFRTRHASSQEIRAIDLRLIHRGAPAEEWIPSVELLNGGHFVLSALAQPDWRKTPATFGEMLAFTNEIRRLLGAGGTD